MMHRMNLVKIFPLVLLAAFTLAKLANAQEKSNHGILTTDALEKYVKSFNANDDELYIQAIPNAMAAEFLARNVPLFECPDKNVERTYYFRWWTYRKHLKQTPFGYIVTEFLPNVPWAAEYNAITCPGTHHFREGRWMKDPGYLHDYAQFWVKHSGYHSNPAWQHFKAVLGHGFPLADALLQFNKVHPSEDLIGDLLPELVANFEDLKRLRKTETGLYWSNAGGWQGDGMEVAIGGDGIRPTINSYMYAQARALAELYGGLGDIERSASYAREAEHIAGLMMDQLWDDDAKFFKVMRKEDIPSHRLAGVRELLGYVPWYYSIPPKDRGYEEAWCQLMDREGFYAPYGPTTAEQRHPKFRISYEGHECQWNGPSWPYATAQTLTAMANVLQEYPQDFISRDDYLDIFLIYTKSHQLQKDDGTIIPWIDENLNPYTGDWLARTRLKTWKAGSWSASKGGVERGKDYNHSTYADLLITGLAGLKPRSDNIVEVNPLLPENTWDYFCLDKIHYKGHILTIIWDKTGKKYDRGKGLILLSDGKEITRSGDLSKVFGYLEINEK